MNSTHQPPGLVAQSQYVAESLYVHRFPCWMHNSRLYHEGQALHLCHDAQRVAHHTGYVHSNYLKMAHHAANLHHSAPVYEASRGSTVPPFVAMSPHIGEIGSHAYVPPMWSQLFHAVPLQCHVLQVSPTHISDQMDGLSIKAMYFEAAQFCIPSPLCFGDKASMEIRFPEFTPLEEALKFFQCEPDDVIAHTCLELKQREASVDRAMAIDHDLDDEDLKVSIWHLLNTLKSR